MQIRTQPAFGGRLSSHAPRPCMAVLPFSLAEVCKCSLSARRLRWSPVDRMCRVTLVKLPPHCSLQLEPPVEKSCQHQPAGARQSALSVYSNAARQVLGARQELRMSPRACAVGFPARGHFISRQISCEGATSIVCIMCVRSDFTVIDSSDPQQHCLPLIWTDMVTVLAHCWLVMRLAQ